MSTIGRSQELRLLKLLSERYPNTTAAHIEMINLNAILALPKGTSHYISDIHGAYEQFDHILRHASGAIRRKISQTFDEQLSPQEQIELAMLIYYPQQKLQQILPHINDPDEWMAAMISHMAKVARTSAQKYTRSKLRKRLPQAFSYILEELLSESQSDNQQREHYYQQIIASIISLGEGQQVIIQLAQLIQNLVVDRLYILGDIYDRGPAAEKVLDRLMAFPDVVIQWGNHDISWMGAAAGCDALIANVLRLSLRYGNIGTLNDGYDISLSALERFANQTYADDPCSIFAPKGQQDFEHYDPITVARMHKAIAIIQFKLDAQIIARHPEFAMNERILLDQIDLSSGTVTIGDQSYPLLDTNWPTLQAENPTALTSDEQAVVDALRSQFQNSKKLDKHIRYLYSYGNMVRIRNGNLMFHGCLPVDENGDFVASPIGNEFLAGPELLAKYDQMVREAYFSHNHQARQAGQDAIWYLWCGALSPLYGRQRMTTFERYFVADEQTHAETAGPYYKLRHNEDFCKRVLAAFGANAETGHIINGHTPVKVRKGESPLFANGRLIVIDGGMSEAYQPVTGIAGYTLIANSHEILLAAHEAFHSTEEMIAKGIDPTPTTELVRRYPQRMHIADTDNGHNLRGQLDDLRKLVQAYRNGILAERS